MSFFSILTPALILVFASHCSDDNASESNPNGKRGLLFVGTDATYSSSALYFINSQDIANLNETTVLPGQTSDSVLFSTDNNLYSFNRVSEALNYRKITTKPRLHETEAGGSTVISDISYDFEFGKQTKTPAPTAGDPHDILQLSADRVLVANYIGGTIHLIEPSSTEPIQILQADWDLPDGAPLRPEQFASASSSKTYFIHQGLDSNYAINGSQQIFELSFEGGVLSAVDADANSPKIQGYKLVGGNPAHISKSGDDQFTIVSFCNQYQPGCLSTVESFASDTGSVTTDFDFSDQSYFSVGNIMPTSDRLIYYGSAEKKNAQGAYERFIIKIDASAKSITQIHSYGSNEANGIWGSFYDVSSSTLWAGDAKNTTEGQFVLYQNESQVAEIETTAIPSYSGIFLDLENFVPEE